MELLELMHEKYNKNGVCAYGWILCDLLNNKEIPLTQTERKNLQAFIRKINKLQYNIAQWKH